VRHLDIKSKRIGVQRLGMQSYTCAIADAAVAVKFQTQMALAGNTKLVVASKIQWTGCDEIGLLEANGVLRTSSTA
jgi:hypothetical protein